MTTRQEWLLMAVAHRKGQPMTPVQIQKAMFLMEAEARHLVGASFYHFVPYNYGPFDSSIYHDLDEMRTQGLVATVGGSQPWKSYAITHAGMVRAEQSKRTANPAGVEFLGRAVDWVASMSFTQLVRAIYAKYPRFRENSVFTG